MENGKHIGTGLGNVRVPDRIEAKIGEEEFVYREFFEFPEERDEEELKGLAEDTISMFERKTEGRLDEVGFEIDDGTVVITVEGELGKLKGLLFFIGELISRAVAMDVDKTIPLLKHTYRIAKVHSVAKKDDEEIEEELGEEDGEK